MTNNRRRLQYVRNLTFTAIGAIATMVITVLLK